MARTVGAGLHGVNCTQKLIHVNPYYKTPISKPQWLNLNDKLFIYQSIYGSFDQNTASYSRCYLWLWLVWLSSLGISPQTKRRLVWFLVRHMSGLGARSPGWGVCERQPIFGEHKSGQSKSEFSWVMSCRLRWDRVSLSLFYPHLRTCSLILKKREGRKTLIWERNINWLPLAHTLTGTKPATQACDLTRNQTYDLSVYETMLEPIEPYWPELRQHL